ncbi:MAG: hypothetical protein ACK55Z_37360, partial [bacterium]
GQVLALDHLRRLQDVHLAVRTHHGDAARKGLGVDLDGPRRSGGLQHAPDGVRVDRGTQALEHVDSLLEAFLVSDGLGLGGRALNRLRLESRDLALRAWGNTGRRGCLNLRRWGELRASRPSWDGHDVAPET